MYLRNDAAQILSLLWQHKLSFWVLCHVSVFRAVAGGDCNRRFCYILLEYTHISCLKTAWGVSVEQKGTFLVFAASLH